MAKLIHVAQGTPEWLAARCGIPTSSCFDQILTAGGKPSTQAEKYMNTLLAEWITGHPVENDSTQWMERGTELEDSAIRAYEFQREVETVPGEFWTTDDGMIGASPDRLIGDKGLLEIKCPLAHTHVGYMRTGTVDEKYRVQLQGQLYVCEREYVDICSYHPELAAVVIRVIRDEKFIALLEAALRTFVDVMLQNRVVLEQKYGPFTRHQPEPPDHSRDFLSDEEIEIHIAGLKSTGAL